jgi:hypothetical protein
MISRTGRLDTPPMPFNSSALATSPPPPSWRAGEVSRSL